MAASDKSPVLRKVFPYVVLTVLVCVFLGPVLFGGRVLLPGGLIGKMSPWKVSAPSRGDVHWNVLAWDSNAEYFPSRTLLGRALRSGEIPLWNPYQFSGYPFLADMLSAVLYPPNLLYAILPANIAVGLLAALQLLAAGIFTFLFLRGLKLSRAASTFGGIAFMLSGFSIAWLELPVFISVAAWLPLTLHLSRLAHERKSIYYAAGAGLTVAMSLLAGHPQIAFYSMLAVGLYWVYLGISGRREVPIQRTVLLACVVFAVGAALAAPQILPMLELASLSHRGVQPPTPQGYAAYSRLAMPFGNLITLLIPDFFGNPARGTYWGYNEYTEYCAYIGILPLLLIPFAFARRKNGSRRQIWFFSGLAVLALLMALGTAVNRLFYYLIPGFTKAGSPARVLVLFVFAAAVLGAFGFDRLLERQSDKRPDASHGVLFAGLGMLVAWVGLLQFNLSRITEDITLADLLRMRSNEIKIFAVFFAAGMGLLLLTLAGKLNRRLGVVLLTAVLCADLISFGTGYNGTCTKSEAYPRTELTSFLQKEAGHSRIMPLNDKWNLRAVPNAVLPPNSAMMYGLYDVSGYDSLYPRKYKELLDAAAGGESCPPENGNMVFARNPGSPIYNLLGVRWIISRYPVEKARNIDGCYVYENRHAFPRAFIVHGVEYAGGGDILKRMAAGSTNLRTVALVDVKDAVNLHNMTFTAKGTSDSDEARISRYTCNTVEVKADTSSAGILVLTDQYYPGWDVYVDGKPAQITRVDYDFRGVPLAAGTHTVLFSYQPKSFRKGLGIAESMLVMLAVLGMVGILDRRRTSDV